MQHVILVSETQISNFLNCHPIGSFDGRKTENTPRNNNKKKKSGVFLCAISVQRELSVIFFLKVFCFPFS